MRFRILIHRTSKGCSALGTASLSRLPSTTQSKLDEPRASPVSLTRYPSYTLATQPNVHCLFRAHCHFHGLQFSRNSPLANPALISSLAQRPAQVTRSACLSAASLVSAATDHAGKQAAFPCAAHFENQSLAQAYCPPQLTARINKSCLTRLPSALGQHREQGINLQRHNILATIFLPAQNNH